MLVVPLLPPAERGTLVLDTLPQARFQFSGPVGERLDANRLQWLLVAPRANPGLLEMFAVRDRKPEPAIVPWAGEFVGKYLLSAIPVLRMADDSAEQIRLRITLDSVVQALLASQAEDGYLGPFPQRERLLGHWDLWGHYHCMQALLRWHEATGDPRALAACENAADLICQTFLEGKRRAYDAGSHEMNLSIHHVLGELVRKTGKPRYRAMLLEVEKDWERAGDYFRSGLAGVEFFRTPRPRWESLHAIQGLVEQYRLTGDERYRQSFLHHWQSIRKWDRRNSGAFSSGEQATGDPFTPSAIETCCTVAWMALTFDALRLTGDVAAADELELSTYNGALGAQHPSGAWWTYSTPMDGVREASHHAIVFQSRAGTPNLNCCSVNAPRALALLADWAVMRRGSGLAVNYFGAMRVRTAVVGEREPTAVELVQTTRYPVDPEIDLEVRPARAVRFPLFLRIPSWSRHTRVTVDGAAVKEVRAGEFLRLEREWTPMSRVHLSLDFGLRTETGALEASGKVSVYRGPLLLAFDPRFNAIDDDRLPRLTPATLAGLAPVPIPPGEDAIGRNAPWLLLELKAGEQTIRLCDFASAGATGRRYRSWLPAEGFPPPIPVAATPADGAVLPRGPIEFRWRQMGAAGTGVKTTVVIQEAPAGSSPVLEVAASHGSRLILEAQKAAALKPGREYSWKLVATSTHGQSESLAPPKRFRIDPQLPPAVVTVAEYGENADGLMLHAPLAGTIEPAYGRAGQSKGWTRADDGPAGGCASVELEGKRSLVRFVVPAFPETDYTAAVWFKPLAFAEHTTQVVSAWCAGMDDPLRLCVENRRLFARIEAGSGVSTPGVTIEAGRWYHVAFVKHGARIELVVDGVRRAEAPAPLDVVSRTTQVGVGGNPQYTGDEATRGRFADFRLWARALSLTELHQVMAEGKKPR